MYNYARRLHTHLGEPVSVLLLKFLSCESIVKFVKVLTSGKTRSANAPLQLEPKMLMQAYRVLVEARYLNSDLLIAQFLKEIAQ